MVTIATDGKNRLNEVSELMMNGAYHEADHVLDVVYEDYSRGRIWLNQEESNYMFCLIDKLTRKLYG